MNVIINQKKIKLDCGGIKMALNLFSSTENSKSDDLVLISADNRENALESLKDIIQSLDVAYQHILKNKLVVSTRHNCLGLARSQFKRLEKFLNASEDIEQEKELDVSLLRLANDECHRLRKEMGKSVSVDSIGMKLYQLDCTIKDWWKDLGFSYCTSNLCPHSRGATFQIDFSINVDKHIGTFEKKPVTKRAELKAKKELLLNSLDIVGNKYDTYVIDNEKNKNWIVNNFKTRFPNCRIFKWELHVEHENDLCYLTHVHVNIDMKDVGDVFEKSEDLQ